MEVGPKTSSTAEIHHQYYQPHKKDGEYYCYRKALRWWRCLVDTLGLCNQLYYWQLTRFNKYQPSTLKQIDCMQLPEGLWKSKLLRQRCRWKISSALSCTNESSVVLYPSKRSTHRPSELRRSMHKCHNWSSFSPWLFFCLISTHNRCCNPTWILYKKSLTSGIQR